MGCLYLACSCTLRIYSGDSGDRHLIPWVPVIL